MIDRPGQIRQSDRHDRAVLTDQLRNVSDRADGDHLQETGNNRFAVTRAKQRVHELESDTHARQILIRIRTTSLVRVKHGDRRRSPMLIIRKMMVGDDNVEAVFARPVQRLVRGNSAIDADDELVTFSDRLL